MTNDLRDLANNIDLWMHEYIKDNPTDKFCKEQEKCEKYVFNKLIRDCKGHIDFNLAQSLIRIHRKPMEEAGYMMQC